MDIVYTILISIFSSGIMVFIMKTIIEKSLKSYFDENFEKKKAKIEVAKIKKIKITQDKIELYKKILELVYRGKNHYRYITAQFVCYFEPSRTDEYKKYLTPKDSIKTLKEIYYETDSMFKNELFDISKKIRETLYENRALFDKEVFKYAHEMLYLFKEYQEDVDISGLQHYVYFRFDLGIDSRKYPDKDNILEMLTTYEMIEIKYRALELYVEDYFEVK